MVAMKMFVKLKKLRRAKRKLKWNIKRLQMNSMPFQSSVEKGVKTNIEMDINQRWMELKKIILNSAHDYIGHERKERIWKSWITQGTISKMDERRRWKSINNEKGKKR